MCVVLEDFDTWSAQRGACHDSSEWLYTLRQLRTHGFIDASGEGTGNTSLICGVIFWREFVEGKNTDNIFHTEVQEWVCVWIF